MFNILTKSKKEEEELLLEERDFVMLAEALQAAPHNKLLTIELGKKTYYYTNYDIQHLITKLNPILMKIRSAQ